MEDRENIHERMLKVIDNKFDKTRGSFFYDATKPAAIEFERKNEEIKEVEGKLNIENLKGDELERFVYQRTGIERKKATKATTVLTVSGTEGAIISDGDLFSTEGGIIFQSTEHLVLGNTGKTEVKVICQEEGVIGNVPANSIVNIPMTIQGVVDVYNESEVKNGYDEETEEALKDRYYEKLQRPAKAGNRYHYEQWAKEVMGVGRVRVVPRFNGLLTIRLIVIDSNGLPADEELINNVTQHIENEMPFGVEELSVIGAEAIEINVSVDLTIGENYIEEAIRENIEHNMIKYLQSIAFNVDYVSYAQIGSIILGTEGVADYKDLKVNNGITNVLIENGQVAIMGVIE